ncbi:MAG: PspA/IM30 family protein [Rhizobiales bacterium]|nr:PspA/IM30 family protein [Hyphomicrobiales bacterium]
MSIFSKIVTALRGGASEVGESIVDANLVRIMDQEIRDSKAAVEKARSGLADLMAEEAGYKRKVTELQDKIEEYEGYAIQALDKGDEPLAIEIAEKIADLSAELDYNTSATTQLSNSIATQKDFMRTSERKVKDFEREAKMVKTTESVQKTAAALSSNFTATGSKMNSARQSLERVKARQQQNADRLKAGEALAAESTGSNLAAKLASSGIAKNSGQASDILAKLKAKQKK